MCKRYVLGCNLLWCCPAACCVRHGLLHGATARIGGLARVAKPGRCGKAKHTGKPSIGCCDRPPNANCVRVSWLHALQYDEGLAKSIVENTRRYADMFASAIDEIALAPNADHQEHSQSVLDIFIQHREVLASNAQQQGSVLCCHQFGCFVLHRVGRWGGGGAR